jgi:hypothetical protein
MPCDARRCLHLEEAVDPVEQQAAVTAEQQALL